MGFKEKTYQILTNIIPDNIEKINNKNNIKYDNFSKNQYANKCNKKNTKFEYERLFTYYNYDNNLQNDKFNSLSNNFQFDKQQKVSQNNSKKNKNIKCAIQLNDHYNQKSNRLKGFEKENICNNNINSFKNISKCLDYNIFIEDSEQKNLYSNPHMETFGAYEIKNECFSENELDNNIKIVSSPMKYISCQSTRSSDNNKKMKYFNQFNNSNNCLSEQKIIKNEKINNNQNKLTYQLESPNEFICFHSKSDFHCEPNQCLEIDNIENFEIINKSHNIENFSFQIISYNSGRAVLYQKIKNKSFTINRKKKLYNNSSIQNNLDEEINKEILRNKRLQMKIAQEKSVYIKGRNKSDNQISTQVYFRINKITKKYKNEGTYMNEINDYTIEFKDEFSIINDNQYKNRRRDLLMQIVLKSILKEKNILKNIFIDWYNKTMKLVDLENFMKKKRLKIKRNGTLEIIQKISKCNKCCGNEFVPNKIDSNLKVKIINNIKKKDKGILIDIPYRFKNKNLKQRKINDIICESNRAYFNKLRINEILIKYICSKVTHESILKKYLSIWYRKSQYIPLLENTKIISKFCKSKLNYILARKKWKKLYQKYLLINRKSNSIKIIRKLKIRKYKLYKLIKITILMQILNKKKFLRYLILCWYINTNKTLTKKNQMKILYENMLTTYISIADDIFGNNKKNNPSIQHSMVEAVESNRYQSQNLEEFYFANKLKYMKSEIEKEKKYVFYEKYINNYISPEKKYKNKNEEYKINYDKRGSSYESKKFRNNIKYLKK